MAYRNAPSGTRPRRSGARIVRLGSTDAAEGETAVTDDGTLAARLRAGRADAVLLRPDRVVLDVVPTGGSDFTGFLRGCPGLQAGEESDSCGAGQG
ncbi:hypothetical protein ACIBJF_32415 [Streptomyces sp. NPDC050743]|uniref:hypothetical protein n=1 Tax=Streptomyces sp. NPDC050743 TaxID=3365634 RepID=UPI0037A8AED1